MLRRMVLVLMGLGLVMGPGVRAQTWDGGGGNNRWTTDDNWDTNVQPVNNGTAAITFAGSVRLAPRLDQDWDVNSITFSSTAGAFVLEQQGNSDLTLRGGGIVNNDADLQTFDFDIILGANQTWSATSGPLAWTSGADVAMGSYALTVSGSFDTTWNGEVSGTGGVTKTGSGVLHLSNPNNTYSGGLTIQAGTVRVAPVFNHGVPTSGSADFLGSGTIVVNGGVLELAPTGAGIDFTGFSRDITVNGGTIRLNPTDEVTGLMSAGTLTFGSAGGTLDIQRPLATGVLLGAVQVDAAGSTPGVIRYGTMANTVGNGGWDEGGRDLNVNNLSGSGALKFELNGATVEYQQSSFSGSLVFSGVAGGNAAAGSTAANVGRVSFDNNTPITVSGGIAFENAMQVTVYYAERTLDADLTVRSGSTTAFQGRGTGAAANDDLVLGSFGTSKTLTIHSGATAVIDTRFRDDLANIGGVSLNLNTDIQSGGTLRFARSVAGGNVDDHTVNGDLRGYGTGSGEAVVDLQLGPAGGAGVGGGVSFAAGSDLVVNGSGNYGLRLQGTGAQVNNLLTDARLQGLTGSGGTLTVAFADNAARTFAAAPSSPSAVLLGLDSQSGSSPTYTLGSTADDLANFNGLVVKGGNVVAGASQSFAGAGVTTLQVLGGSLDLGNGGVARTLAFEGSGTLAGGSVSGGSGSARGTLSFGGDLVSNGTTLLNSPNLTMSPVAGTTSVGGSVGLSGVGTFTKTGAGTTRLDQTVAADQVVVSQGTLLLGASERIGNTTGLTLAGGTLATGGFSESLGVLTLTANSVIDLGPGMSDLYFSSTSSGLGSPWPGGSTITIQNWSGDYWSGGGVDQVRFGSITGPDVSHFQFLNPSGLPAGLYAARLIGLEIVPVPEPSTYAVLVLLGAGLFWRRRGSAAG